MMNEYANSNSLNARAQIYKFITARKNWTSWVFDQIDLPSGSKILELGCGTGALWQDNIHRIHSTWSITLTDLSPGMLEEARSKLSNMDKVFKFQFLDATVLPFKDESFDAVIANHMLYYVSDLDITLSEINRVLKTGGKLYASTNGPNHMKEIHDIITSLMSHIGRPHDEVVSQFSLENGCKHLERYFSSVECRYHAGDLEVTEVQPVIDYILSLEDVRNTIDRDILIRLKTLIDNEIQQRGNMHITREAGLFVANKD